MVIFTDAEKQAMSALPPGFGQLQLMVKKLQSLPRGLPISAGEQSKTYRLSLCNPGTTPGMVCSILWHPHESSPFRTSLSIEQQKAVGYATPASPIVVKEEYAHMSPPEALGFIARCLVGDILHTFVDFRAPADPSVVPDSLFLRGHEVTIGQAPEGFIVLDLAMATNLVNQEFMTRLYGDSRKKLFAISTQPMKTGSMQKQDLTKLISFCSALACAKMGSAATLSKCSACSVAWYCNRECQKAHYPTHKPTCKKIAALYKAGEVPIVWLDQLMSEQITGYSRAYLALNLMQDLSQSRVPVTGRLFTHSVPHSSLYNSRLSGCDVPKSCELCPACCELESTA